MSELHPTEDEMDDADFGSTSHRRLRWRRHRRRAYIRSVYALPSLATLGNAVCGFGAIYVSSLNPESRDPVAQWLARDAFVVSAYLIFLAMVFDAIDGRLARFARHTTDFGGQLDSLADVISFGVAPAILAANVFKHAGPQEIPLMLSRIVWALSALYMACAAIRLARFNVSNKHGEQHHFSFLGLPSPGAGGAVAGFVLLQQSVTHWPSIGPFIARGMVIALPVLVAALGLLMVSNIRYGHLVNRYLRGRRSLARVIVVMTLILLIVAAHEVVIGISTLLYALAAPATYAFARLRRHHAPAPEKTPA